MCITCLKKFSHKIKSLKCVRKPHPYTATLVFSNLSFLLFMAGYSQYFTVLGDRMMMYHHENCIPILCFSKFPSQRRFWKIVLSWFLASHPLSVSHIGNRDVYLTFHCGVNINNLSMQRRHLHWIQDQVASAEFLLEIVLRRNLFWKAEFGPVEFALIKFVHAYLSPEACVTSSYCGLVYAQ